MHRVAHVDIENYRSCKHFEADLSDFTALVGYNNGGKTNLLTAIKWGVRGWVLQDQDFCDSSTPLSVTLRIEGITPDLLEKLGSGHRPRIEPYCFSGALTIRRTQASPGGTAKSISLEVLSSDGSWKPNPTGIDAAIAAILPDPIEIGAMQDAAEDVGKSKSGTTIGKLIAEVVRPIETSHSATLSTALQAISAKFDAEGSDRALELVAIDEGTNKKLETLFPGVSIRVHVPAPEIKEIFKSGTIKVFEDRCPTGRDIESLGHGAQRSIQMALVRHLAEIKQQASGGTSRTLFLIDEPELYLHPNAIEQVRIALKTLSETSYQVVLSTHSPLMITSCDVANALIVVKDKERGTIARIRLRDAVQQVIADAPSQTEALFELSNLSQVLFSDRVLLAEGQTERRLIPEMYSSFHGRSIGSDRLGLVSPNGSGGIPNCMRILRAIGIVPLALVDLDFAFKTAVCSRLFPKDDATIVKCRKFCKEKKEQYGYEVSEDGFPCKSAGKRASDAYEDLASDGDMAPLIAELHNRLKGMGYWLWKRGAIEAHLGIGKGKANHSIFVEQIRRDGIVSVVKDQEGITEFLSWLAASDGGVETAPAGT